MPAGPVWAEIDLGAVARNVQALRGLLRPGTRLMAVVKANAYGHGAVEVSRVALAAGADMLGVARVAEGAMLRRAGIDAPILVLGCVPPHQCDELIRFELRATVYNRELAEELAAAGRRRGTRVPVHVKVDTGMGRLGWLTEDRDLEEVLRVARLPGLEVEGIFTHFAAADERDKAFTRRQLALFLDFLERLKKKGLEVPYRHAANSAALIDLPETQLDLVRPGISLYGLYPSPEVDRARVTLHPAMTFKTVVAAVKRVPAGFTVSYGCTYVTPCPSVIATIPAGYADGYSRLLSSRGQVLIHGRRARVVGRVCMDMFMVDVSHIPDVAVGDEVVLFGRQGGAELPVEEVAGTIGTINYEVVCMVSARVPRVYLRDRGAVLGEAAGKGPGASN